MAEKTFTISWLASPYKDVIFTIYFIRGFVQHQRSLNFHLHVNYMLNFEVKYASVKWHHPAVLGIGSYISSIQYDLEKKLAALQTGH